MRVCGDGIKTLLLIDCIHGSLTAWYTNLMEHVVMAGCKDNSLQVQHP